MTFDLDLDLDLGLTMMLLEDDPPAIQAVLKSKEKSLNKLYAMALIKSNLINSLFCFAKKTKTIFD